MTVTGDTSAAGMGGAPHPGRIDPDGIYRPLRASRAAPMRVLVVEDEPLVAFELLVTIERLGGEVSASVATEAEALDAVARDRPDVVLMDIGLAEGNGISAARRILDEHAVPIVFVTGDGAAAMRERLREFARAPVVVKPFRTRELLGAMLSAAAFAADARESGSAG